MIWVVYRLEDEWELRCYLNGIIVKDLVVLKEIYWVLCFGDEENF